MNLNVSQFCPIFHFHPDERYFPSSVEYYVANSSMVRDGSYPQVVSAQLSPQQLTKHSSKDASYYLKTKTDITEGFGDNLRDAPLYYTLTETDSHWVIQWIIFYPFSGEYNPLGNCFTIEHHADFERVTVRIDKTTLQTKDAYFGITDRQDGHWVKRDQLMLEPGTERIHVYVAYLNHGNYDDFGVWVRTLGLVNDYTSNDGEKWDPMHICQIDEKTNWNCWKGYFDEDCYVLAPRFQQWWRQEEGSTNFTFLKRLFGL